MKTPKSFWVIYTQPWICFFIDRDSGLRFGKKFLVSGETRIRAICGYHLGNWDSLSKSDLYV